MTIKDLSNYPGNIKENIKDKSGLGVKIKSYNTIRIIMFNPFQRQGGFTVNDTCAYITVIDRG